MEATLNGNLNLILSYKSDIKSAIEAKGVDMTGLSFPDYPGAIASIPVGGEFTEKDVTEGNFQIVNLNNSASYVTANAFKNNTYLQTVTLPNCMSIYSSAFYGCSVSSVSLPVCNQIFDNAFYGNMIPTVNFPLVTFIGMDAFKFCHQLTEVSLPEVISISGSAFYGCDSLQYVSLPLCSVIGANTFASCIALSQIELPSCTVIQSNLFNGCTSLEMVSLPVCTLISNNAFDGCSSLSEIDLPNCISININGTFARTALNKLTLGASTICSLYSFGVFTLFNGTPIASGTGSIYVPASLVSDYQVANYWSQYASQIFAIPEP